MHHCDEVDIYLKPVWEKPSDLLKNLREQRRIELEHITALKPTMNSLHDRLAVALLESLIHDSKKHASLCKALIDIERGGVRREMDVGAVIDLVHAIEEHLEVEAVMIQRLETMQTQSQDERTRLILGYMLSDERRHHSILTRLLERIR